MVCFTVFLFYFYSQKVEVTTDLLELSLQLVSDTLTVALCDATKLLSSRHFSPLGYALTSFLSSDVIKTLKPNCQKILLQYLFRIKWELWDPIQKDITSLTKLLLRDKLFYVSIVRTAIIKANYTNLSKELKEMDNHVENCIYYYIYSYLSIIKIYYCIY